MELLIRFGLESGRMNGRAPCPMARRSASSSRAAWRPGPGPVLDEPAAGMNPVEIDALSEAISTIGRSGIGVMLVEHHMKW